LNGRKRENDSMKILKSFAIVSLFLSVIAVLMMSSARRGESAYHHMGEKDTDIFLTVYPKCRGTKLDNCSLCHSGGSYGTKESTVNLGSCQWCHYKYGYTAPHGDIMDTLNPFGRNYLEAGRSAEAIRSIERKDSDADGYVNVDEIAAVAYPGDPDDNPMKVTAPSRVYSLEQLEKMPQHSQLMLLNAHKSKDYYANYTGVALEDLLKDCMLPTATGIKVYSPDGFSQYYPLKPDPNPLFYHVNGVYPQARYYYDSQADCAKNKDGWCEYQSPALQGKNDDEMIVNPHGLRLLLAIKRDGTCLGPGTLGPQNKLDGEGPFRVLPPQKFPCPPDQRQSAPDAANSSLYKWPFDYNADHNAGFSTRSATIIKVEPLPEGTTDINTAEAGWNYVDGKQIVIYGAVNPLPGISDKLESLKNLMEKQAGSLFREPGAKDAALRKIGEVRKSISGRRYSEGVTLLETDLMNLIDSSMNDTEGKKKCRWSVHELIVLLKILN
jgi:hypothetical protein